MKFLTVPRLQKLSGMMQAVDVGDRIIHARIEAYSCKLAGGDKRAAKEIGSALEASLSHATAFHSGVMPSSPLGDLTEPSTKHLLVSLITTLNASYPDYDFSNLRPDEFEREEAPQIAMDAINSLFLTAIGSSLSSPGFRSEFWSALEETIVLHECDIFKFDPSAENDLNIGKLWTVHYFFFNRKLKKMVLLTAEAVSKLHLQNAHSQAYQMNRRRIHAADDDDDGEFDEDASDMDMEDDVDASMMAAEQAMLDDLDEDDGVAGDETQTGAYVDVNLLEWEGLPPEELIRHKQMQRQSSESFPSSTSSPSSSSMSSASSVRMRALPDAATTTAPPPPAQRLASTRTPNSSRSTTTKPAGLGVGHTNSPSTGLFGTISQFQTLSPSSNTPNLPAVPLFSQQQ